MKKLITLPLLFGALCLSGAASACQLTAWSASNGAAAAGGPGDTPNIARYSGLCSMQTSAAADYVQDDSPAAEGRMISRFYFRADGGTGTIFEAFSDAGTTSLFTVDFDGTNVTTSAGAGGLSVAASASGWNSVELDWNMTGSTADLWVNSDATIDAADASGAASGAAVETVRLGGAGFLFDAYEARRTTAVGRLVAADANGDGNVALADAVLILREFLGLDTDLGTPALDVNIGQPDTNEDGSIGLADAVLALRIALGL